MNISTPNNIICGPGTQGNYTYVFNDMINTDIHTDLTLIAITLINEYTALGNLTIAYANNTKPGVYSSSNVESGAYNTFPSGQLLFNVNGGMVTTIPTYDNVNTSVLSTIEPIVTDTQPYWTSGNQQYYARINISTTQPVSTDPPICIALQRLVVVVP
ncbi:hypothetical protein [Metallosphaera sp.]